jgi:hypothetical protein
MGGRALWIGAAVAVLAIATFVGWNVVGSDDGDSGKLAPLTTSSNGPSGPASIPPDFEDFRDTSAGFALAHPTNWKRLPSTDPQVSLIATPNGRDSLLVRVARVLERPIGPGDLNQVQQFTDEVVKSSPGVELVTGARKIDVAGLPGFFYLYRFKDEASGQTGAHSHYFLFRDRAMITVVFQALPETTFQELAPLFDQIMGTFRTL